MRLFSTFLCLTATLLLNSFRVSAADSADAFTVFKAGKLAGTAGPGIITGSNGLIYANSASNRMTIRRSVLSSAQHPDRRKAEISGSAGFVGT